MAATQRACMRRVCASADNLHQDAGSTGVIEYHGSLMTSVCRRCKAPGGPVPPLLSSSLGAFPPKCTKCGGPLKPSAILFGEAIPVDAAAAAAAAAAACDVMLVVGTSASVRPAADLPRLALAAGATVVEVNTEATGLTGRTSDIILRGKAGVVLPQVVDAVKRIRASRGAGSGGGGDGGGGSGGGAVRVSAAQRGSGAGLQAALCAAPGVRRARGRRSTPRAAARAALRSSTPAAGALPF
jgi:hypothetical protein